MESIPSNDSMDNFLKDVGVLLGDMEVYLNNVVPTDSSTDLPSSKHSELVRNFELLKTYYTSHDFLQANSKQHAITVPTLSDGNNNNNTLAIHDSGERGLEGAISCFCSDLQSICVIPRSLEISSARSHHFTRSLQDRMMTSENKKFALYLSDLLYKEHTGWLYVDKDHRYFGVVADCLFCLFENEESQNSLMNLILNDTRSQSVKSTTDQHAFTITIEQDEELYFCATSVQDQIDWLRWLNVGAQLPFDNLFIARKKSLCCEKSTQTVSVSSETASVRRRNFGIHKGPRPHSYSGSKTGRPLSLIQQTSITEEESEGELDNQKCRDGSSTDIATENDVIDTSGVRMRQKSTSTSRASSNYDWSRDQGTTRTYPSTDQLNGELCLKKGVSFTEGVPTMPTPRQSRPKSSATLHYVESGLSRQSASNRSLPTRADKSTKWGSRILRRASLLFTSKTDISQQSGSSSMDAVDAAASTPTSPTNRKPSTKKRYGSDPTVAASGLSTVDMAGFCEIQGYLYCKKMLKWTSQYCCVYNGTFSCFKDANSSLPEIQCQLKDCMITPLDEKKVKRPFAFKLTPRNSKSTYFSAVSDVDLHSWYSIFNNYIRRALALSKYRGGAYPLWEWEAGTQSPASYTASTVSSDAESESSEHDDDGDVEEALECDKDLPMVEKTSADGASHHSAESDGPHEESPKSETTSEGHSSGTQSGSVERVSPVSTKSNTVEGETCNSAGLLIVQQHIKEASIMRSASESDYQRTRTGQRGNKSMAQFYCKSVDDLPSLTSSSGSSSGDEGYTDLSYTKPKRSSAEQRKHLIDKMMKEKLRIEQALQLKRQRDEEDLNNEVLANITKLQQRRVSTQLKYNYLERQLRDKKEDKSRYSGMFQKNHKHEKTIKQPVVAAPTVDSSESNNQHIRRQMDELKRKLDSLDKGLNESKSKHTTNVNKVLLNRPALTIDHSTPSTPDSLSEHRLRGLESIIETLENPNQIPTQLNAFYEAQKLSCQSQDNNNYCQKCLGDIDTDAPTDPPLEIRPETLAVISEFETMTKELLNKRPSVNYLNNYD